MAGTNVPAELKYTEEHEWVRQEGDVYVIGITDFAQDSLGDVVYVEVGDVGDTLKAGKGFGVVESVKAASDLFAPISGEIVEINQTVIDSPDLLNSDPYGDAWLVKVRATNESELEKLLDADAYTALLG
jgi:glycine cleavage system H protein